MDAGRFDCPPAAPIELALEATRDDHAVTVLGNPHHRDVEPLYIEERACLPTVKSWVIRGDRAQDLTDRTWSGPKSRKSCVARDLAPGPLIDFSSLARLLSL
jgi:hypothetical protein